MTFLHVHRIGYSVSQYGAHTKWTRRSFDYVLSPMEPNSYSVNHDCIVIIYPGGK